MTTTIETPTAGVSAVKRARRGVSNKTQAVSQLKFHEKDAAQNGLFVGHLEEVRVDYSINADGKSFTGLNVPRLTFHFASNHVNASEKRHVYQTLFPVESNVNTIPGGVEEWKVNNVFNWIKHILDVYYLKGRELTAKEEEALTLNFEDFDANGDYVSVEPETVLAAYGELFTNAVKMFYNKLDNDGNENGMPVFMSGAGKYIPCWIKLLRHRKRKSDWINVGANGDLAFDNFIGNGVIELMKKDSNPTVLRLDLSKESITPKETKKAPSIGVNTIGGQAGSVMVGDMPVSTGNFNDTAYMSVGEEMPF